MYNFRLLVLHELKMAMRRRGSLYTLFTMFVVMVTLFPLALGSDMERLRPVGIGVVWVCALLAANTILGRVFEDDYRSGWLEQLYLQPVLPSTIFLTRVTAHWLITGVPLMLISPVLLLLFGVSSDAIMPLLLALLLSTPTISLLGAMGAALTLGIRRAGGLVALLVTPLYIPVLLFGVNVSQGSSGVGMLAVMILLALPLCTLAGGAALVIAMEE